MSIRKASRKSPRQFIDEAMLRRIGFGAHGTSSNAHMLTGSPNATTRALVDEASYNVSGN